MHGELLLDHFQNPRNAGTLAPPAVTVDVMNPICGDSLRHAVLWSADGRAAEVRFQARGCTAAIACASALTELLVGRSLAQMRALTLAEIEAAVGGLINESKHAAVLCRDAVRALQLPT
jgi:nitrogen fixation protein NifU and related proteins